MRNAKGQGAIEAIIVMPIIAVFMIGILVAFYYVCAHTFANYLAEEALICTTSNAAEKYSFSVSLCEQKLRLKLKAFLFLKDKYLVQITQNSETAKVQISIQPNVGNFISEINVTKELYIKIERNFK